VGLVGLGGSTQVEMNIPVQKITLAIFAAIGSVFMMASAIGTLWAWTTPDVSLGFRFMFPLLAASLFALVFMLSMTLVGAMMPATRRLP
jgi:hypothetical protein